MSTQTRAGIRAARALLSLLEENSAEELEAAEAILGGEKELTNILQLLRKFKEHEEEPLSVERLREIVRRELVGLRLPAPAIVIIVHSVVGGSLRISPTTTAEQVVDRALHFIETHQGAPSAQVDALTALLIAGFHYAEPDDEAKIEPLLRDLAIQALAENVALFPTLHSLSQLRIRWAGEPLPYKQQESRRRLATRLLMSGEELLTKEDRIDFMRGMLREGLRNPADAAIAEVRRMKPKKAHGE